MEYRNEWKYLVSQGQLTVLEHRLRPLMKMDEHQAGRSYAIRSLYFDDLRDSALYENKQGLDNRRKFRIRIYNASDSFIHLEIKEKLHGKTKKTACLLSPEQCRRLMAGIPPQVDSSNPPPLNLLAVEMKTQHLMPKVIVEYERTAFVGNPGNVRVTFDRNISASAELSRFLDPSPMLVPVLPVGQHVLEVKYDELIPDTIAQAIEIGNMTKTAFSKYSICREFLIDHRVERK